MRAYGERCRQLPCKGSDMTCYVTDVRGFTGRGDSFTEHTRRIPEVLMIVLKYLAGQIFFLMYTSRAVNTSGPQDHCEVKGLKRV